MNDISFFCKNEHSLASILSEIPGIKSYNSAQIIKWFSSSVYDFSLMTNLPKSLRESLIKDYNSPFSSTIEEALKSDDNSLKLAVKLFDLGIIECVLLKNSDSTFTACLSSQVGCAMGCAFCRTGTLKLKRNLYDYEIVEQFAHLHNIAVNTYKSNISHVVFMGMGEPLANLSSVLSSINYLHDVYNIGYRRITISTCGLVSGIEELISSNIPVKLAVSLVTADDSMRSVLMPVNKAFNLSRLKSTLIKYQNVYNRRITLEYCMLSNINTDYNSAQNLLKFLKGLNALVNLIPFNPAPELKYKVPTPTETELFKSYLDKLKIMYTVRNSKGKNILGACGQLAHI